MLGLQGAGKSTFVHVINTGSFSDGLMPTVGFNMHKVQRGAVTIKVWDMVNHSYHYHLTHSSHPILSHTHSHPPITALPLTHCHVCSRLCCHLPLHVCVCVCVYV